MAKEVGLSTTPTLRRVRQVGEDGLIRGYTAQLDETRLIGEIPVFISVTLERQVSEVLNRLCIQLADRALAKLIDRRAPSWAETFREDALAS